MKYHYLRYPGGKAKAVTFSYDDGGLYDIPLAETLTRYGIKGTFNLCCGHGENDWQLSIEQVQTKLLDCGHEIAVHCQNHVAPGNARLVKGIQEVVNCRLDLEKKFQRIVRGMAYPDSGITRFSNGVSYEQIRAYLQELDIAYARSLGADNNRFELPADWYNWLPTAHHDNPNLMQWIGQFNIPFEENHGYIANRGPMLFYLWGHSFEFEGHHNWAHLDEICAELGGKADVWYATNMEIYDYVHAYESLIYSADCNRIYNPTLIDVFMEIDKQPCVVPSGKTLLLNA